MKVQVLFIDGCPNHEELLPRLRELLRAADAAHAEVELVRIDDAEAAEQQRFLGSPTVRVDGEDVEPGADERRDFGLTCRVFATPDGLRPIDGPFGDFNDPDGYLAAARRAAVLGFEGKWAIHPNQIPLAHQVFSPDERLVTRTRRIVEAMKEAADQGKGAVSLDGRLIDAASLRMAEHLLAKIDMIESRAGSPVRAVGSSTAWPARSSSAS